MSAPRFVRLTQDDGSPIWLRVDAIDSIHPNPYGGASVSGWAVRETLEEILALLAVPAPAVEVTKDAVEAAEAMYSAWSNMRAAIEAADRARGLRT